MTITNGYYVSSPRLALEVTEQIYCSFSYVVLLGDDRRCQIATCHNGSAFGSPLLIPVAPLRHHLQ